MISFIKNLCAPSFEDFANNWLNDEYARHAPISLPKKRQLLEKSVFPFIGHKRITNIKYQDIVKILLTYRENAPRSGAKLAQILYRIFSYANVIGGYKIDNPVKKDELKLILNPTKSGEFAVLESHKLPEFFVKIDKLQAKKPETKIAFWVLAYTALRRSEVMYADWSEIDFQNKVWTIPITRMKTRQSQHIIPLSPQVIELLLTLQQKTGRTSGKLFKINPATPLRLCSAAGYKNQMTLHGLRKVFSTYSHESKIWSIDAVEIQLAHIVPGVRGVYNKAQYIDERKQLMCWYADTLDKMRGIESII